MPKLILKRYVDIPILLSFSISTHPNIQNVIEINRPPLPVYQTVIEKTRGLALRTQAIGAALASGGLQAHTQAQAQSKSEAQPAVVEGAR
jgi:translation initiation factor 3 subunit E